ncbi:hypothetical protein HNO53_00540 [Billgrantia antri]|uniref:Uncharacterized protein n=1 Tax=Halomonas sulfidivorans TaxID=2733488 RepID=A0ABX7WB39_9GAMM|nr:hypothetical protein [Halomonas sulfidivorans]QTP57335.1 hypothetical protein HNO53_00540 [Halomonas sulfidivorans]
MLPTSFKASFDVQFITGLYQRLQEHDDSIVLLLRTKAGRKSADPEKASFGEIRNADGKMFFGMNGKEGIVHLKKAGSLGGPLLAYLKEEGVGQQDVTYDLGAMGVCAYAVLVAVVGFFYSSQNYMPLLFLILLACIACTLLGVALMAHAYKEGNEAWAIPALVCLGIGALPTAPASLLVLPMMTALGRAKLQRLLQQGDGESVTEVSLPQ